MFSPSSLKPIPYLFSLLLLFLLHSAGNAAPSLATEYRVGTGKAIVTDPASGLGMVGFADGEQKTDGVSSRLYARTFIVEDKASKKRVVLMNADLWAMPHAVKREVVNKLKAQYGNLYDYDNCHFSATHTHGGPGGYTEYNLYNLTVGGFDQTNFDLIVAGIVRSIGFAHRKLADGNVYFGKTPITDCGRNRSLPAYNKNPASERNRYASQTDNELYLLKFTQVQNGTEVPVGALSWYAIHPTDRGQKNQRVTADNKGFASQLIEKKYRTFTAAFANGSAGDVSGALEYGRMPDGVTDQKRVAKHGKQQADAADLLLRSTTKLEMVKGGLDYRHQFWDMKKRTGSYGALGWSFGAGSTEDSDAGFGLPEGMNKQAIRSATTSAVNHMQAGMVRDLTSFLVNTSTNRLLATNSAMDAIQNPKPILFYSGTEINGFSLTPNVLPFQLIRIGQVAITGIPAEINTMAGRRVQRAVQASLPAARHVVLGGYANHYAQYVATPEEYDAQHYEGASTLFGRNTLTEYLKIYQKLAMSIRNGTPLRTENGHTPPNQLAKGSVMKLNRVTIRNLSKTKRTFDFYNRNDMVMLASFKKVTVPANGEVAVITSPQTFKVRMDGRGAAVNSGVNRLLRVDTNGKLGESGYLRRNFVKWGNPRPVGAGGSSATGSAALPNNQPQLRVSVGGKAGWKAWGTVTAPLSQQLYGDFNGDGTGDVLVATGNGFNIYDSGKTLRKGFNSSVAAASCRVGDFNGDGKDDVLHYHAGSYHYSSGGTGGWTKLFTSIITMKDVLAGDFNGDGKDDVFASWNGYFRYYDLAKKDWVILTKSSIPAKNLRVVRFQKDGIDDIATSLDKRVKVCYNGRGGWQNKVGTSIPLSRLAFADIDGDGLTDMITTSGTHLRVSKTASTGWVNYVGTSLGISSLRFADLDGKGGVEMLSKY